MRKDGVELPEVMARRAESAEDVLLDLASRMDSDGGMPGKSRESRTIATVIALLAFLSQGHTPKGGVFRSHVGRLVSFLQSQTRLSRVQKQIVDAVLESAGNGAAPTGHWIALTRASGNHWRKVGRIVLSA